MSWTNVEWAHGESIADFAPRMDQMHSNNRYLREDASRYQNIMTIPQELSLEKTFYDTSGTYFYGRVRFMFGTFSAAYNGTSSSTWVARYTYFAVPSPYTDPFIPCMCRLKFEARNPATSAYSECSTDHNNPVFYWPFNDTANQIRWDFDMKISNSMSGNDLTMTVHIKNMTLRPYYSPGAFASGGFDLDAFG